MIPHVSISCLPQGQALVVSVAFGQKRVRLAPQAPGLDVFESQLCAYWLSKTLLPSLRWMQGGSTQGPSAQDWGLLREAKVKWAAVSVCSGAEWVRIPSSRSLPGGPGRETRFVLLEASGGEGGTVARRSSISPQCME